LSEQNQRNADADNKRVRSLFLNVAPIYIEDYAKPRKRTWLQDEQTLARNFLPHWKDRILDEIETIEVADRLREIEANAKLLSPTSKGYHAANRALAVLRKMYNWAIANGYATRSPVTSGMSRGNTDEELGSRKRDFTDDEIRRIWRAYDALPLNASVAVKMLMLTGQRSGVVGGMKHSEIDREEMTWTISADAVGRAKNKLKHRVPLTNSMMLLIDGITMVDGIDHVFCSHHRGDKKITIGSKYKNILNANCGFGDWTFQGLRGLVVTRMRRKPLRIDRDIVDLIEGRLPDSVQRRHYDSNEYMDEKLDALQRWNDNLLKIIENTVDDAANNVVQITA
jgi:integrase